MSKVRVSRAQSPALSETKPTETKGKEQKSSQKAKVSIYF